jgi:hypothetical protein
MRIRGIVQSAVLKENPAGSDQIEMIIWGQGVGPDKPRQVVVPYQLLLQDPSIDPDLIRGHGFEAEVLQEEGGRWIVQEIGFAAGNVLRNLGN